MVTLPTKPIPAETQDPKNLIIFGLPKVGKTTVLSTLENNLILDFENGSDYVDALKIKIASLKDLKETIKARKETDAENKYIDDVLEAASKTCEVDVPEVMVNEEAHRMVHQYEEHLQMQGLTLEQFFKYTNSNEQALMDQMHDEAYKRVLYRLMLEAIVKAEKLEVSESDAEEEAKKLAEKYQMDVEEFKKAFGGLDMIKYDLSMRAAIDVLKGNK